MSRIKLTPLQLIHYPTVKFLLGGTRGVGKSYLIAYAFLMEAIENPGKEFEVVDFPTNTFRHREYLLKMIWHIANELNIQIDINKSRLAFRILNINPYLDDQIVRKANE